jgi:hypothetical protein
MNQLKYENKLIKVNLLISSFYDGVQVFHRKFSDFWPLMITILNLPPSLRNKIGVGMFLLTMMSSAQGSNAENYLMDNCFVNELQLLHKGIVIHCRDQYFFVQVRLIQHCVDTKALGHVLKVQEAGSCAGCPFCKTSNIGRGTKRLVIDKVVYPGHRILLPNTHVFRFYGKSQVCCPPSYYAQESMFNIVLESIRKNKKNLFHAQCLQMDSKNNSDNVVASSETLLDDLIYSGSCEIEGISDKDYLRNAKITNQFYKSTKEPYCWFHENFHHTQFREYIQFINCDLRMQISNDRKSNEQYLREGEEAQEQNRIKKTKKEVEVNGVKGVWPYDKIPDVDFEFDVCFDPFHSIMNLAKHTLDLIKENVKPKTGKFCLSNNIHPFLWPKKTAEEKKDNNNNKKKKNSEETKKKKLDDKKDEVRKSPYNIPTLSDQLRVEAWMNAILIPMTHTASFQIRAIMTETGSLYGSAAIAIFSSAINYFNLALQDSVSNEYKDFFSMIGSDITELLSFSFCDKDIDYLEKQIIELVCLFEAMFTEAECTFMVHELIHLAPHIKQMGPLKGWWTYAGERAMHFVKTHVSSAGGKAFDKTAMKKYNNSESVITKQFYLSEIKKIMNTNKTVYYGTNGQMFFDNNLCKLLNLHLQHKKMKFTTFEMDKLLNCLISEIQRQCLNIEEALEKSTIFQLYAWFENFDFPKNTDNITIYEWILILYDLIFINSVNEQRESSTDLSKYGAARIELENSKKDLKNTVISLVQLFKNIKIYQNAIIYGIRFSSRGFDFREFIEPKIDYVYGRAKSHDKYKPNLLCNQLSKFNNWQHKKQTSSWCRYILWNNGDVEGIFNQPLDPH